MLVFLECFVHRNRREFSHDSTVENLQKLFASRVYELDTETKTDVIGMNNGSVAVHDELCAFSVWYIVCKTLEADLIVAAEQAIEVDDAARQFVAQIVILAKISPARCVDLSDVESQLLSFLKKKSVALRQLKFLLVAVDNPIGFHPFYNIVVTTAKNYSLVVPSRELVDTHRHRFRDSTVDDRSPLVDADDAV